MLGFTSPDAHCYSFDDRANGYSRGEGVAFVALKRLSRALADGDTIRAVIRGTGSNQDGRTPAITQPNTEAQEALIRKTYAAAGLNFSDTTYYEAHGTGTAVGDPTETAAIGRVFSEGRSADDALHVGSLKANMGHLEPSAGIVGLIKVIMMFERGMIPPNAMLKNLNPRIHASEWRLNVSNLPLMPLWHFQSIRRFVNNCLLCYFYNYSSQRPVSLGQKRAYGELPSTALATAAQTLMRSSTTHTITYKSMVILKMPTTTSISQH